MTKQKVQYYVNMGSYKQLATGYKINEELAYSTLGKHKYITHVATGMQVVNGKESIKNLTEKALHLLESNQDVLLEKLTNNNLESLPVVESLLTREDEFEYIFGFRVPYSFLEINYEVEGYLDVIELDNKISTHAEYNHDISLNDNVLNIYGKRGLELVDFFTETEMLDLMLKGA